MSVHCAQTPSGTRPTRISRPKTLHPRQSANTASSVAATMTATRNTSPATASPKPRASTAPAPVMTAPMPCAKRLGGPGTSFAGPIRGASTFVASSASGLRLGPATTRATKPTARTASSQCAEVTSATAAISATQPATTRAAFSLTVAGNERTPDTT